jgi:hypothetical protein
MTDKAEEGLARFDEMNTRHPLAMIEWMRVGVVFLGDAPMVVMGTIFYEENSVLHAREEDQVWRWAGPYGGWVEVSGQLEEYDEG